MIGGMRGVGRIAALCKPELGQPPFDVALGRLAGRQYGVVSLKQLRVLGLSPRGVRSRVTAGTLHRIHRGVYAVGHPVLRPEARLLAAVLACGPGAVVSHRAAADWQGIRPSNRKRIDVTVPRVGRTRPGIDLHRSGTLAPDDIETVRGIPCTTVGRTLLDLAEIVDKPALARACHEAEVLRVFDLRQIDEVLRRAAGRRGAAALRDVVADYRPDEARTRTALERDFLALCEEAGVARPRVNTVIDAAGGTLEVDFAWPDQKLVVEVDGYATHGTRRGFEVDRERDRRLMLAGWRVARFTWRQVRRASAEELRELLASRDERAIG
jgi:predicted transcriptional regulator of viral defense system